MSKKSKSIDPSVLVAVIGVVGTIIAALITALPNLTQKSEATQPPIIQPVASSTSVSAAAPESTTSGGSATVTEVVPTSTLALAPTLAVGEDWSQNCISAAWQTYPINSGADVNDGCYVNLFNSVFTAQSGALKFFLEKRVSSPEVSGVFAELPSNVLVSLKVHLDELQGGEVWVGVFEQPDIQSKGFVVAVLPGNSKNSGFAALGLPAATNLFSTGKYPKDTGDYSVALDVTPNTVFGLIELYTKTKEFSLASGEKWLFIGYRALTSGTNRIEGNFFDLVITPR